MRLWSEQLQQYLQPNNALTRQTGSFPAQAAVLMLFTRHPSNPEIIFTLRAQHLTNHPGEVSFPGGMWEPQDATLLDTALRETHEEIGLSPAAVHILGAGRPRATHAGIKVTPFIGVVEAATEFVPNLTELDAVFRVPLSAFHAGIQTRTDIFSLAGKSYRIPAYHHEGYEIWGFTAALTSEILTAITASANASIYNDGIS